MTPLRIALDGDTLGRKRTGDESYLASLMRGLGRIDPGREYVVLTRDPAAAAAAFPELSGWRFVRVRPKSVWLRYPVGLPLALRRERPDVLHVQYFLPPACPCPSVVTVHDVSFAVRPEFFTLRDRIFLGTLVPASLRRADCVITDTQYTRRELIRVYGLPQEKIAVIPLAADPRYRPLERERCRRDIAARHGITQPFILYVGTLQPRKNPATLIRAYARMRRRSRLPHKLLIVGKPKYLYDEVFEAIRTSGVEADVLFAGFVRDDDLPTYYNAAELLAFPSHYEGFGLPVVEAMQCGTPVVCSNASCLPEVVGDAAILADPHDADAFADALERVLSDPAAAATLAERGRRRAGEFSWEQTARRTLAVYQAVAQAARDGGTVRISDLQA